MTTTTYGAPMERAYDSQSEAELPTSVDDCYDFYWYNDDDTKMTTSECLSHINS